MYDRDAVIRHASEAAQNHASDVHVALAEFIRQGGVHGDALRAALIAQAAGFEANAHDGSTLGARIDAAKAALAAWDGPSAGRGIIRIGSRAIRCDIRLAMQAGWEHSYADSNEIRAPYHYPEHQIADLGRALGEGLDGDAALLRALVFRDSRIHEAANTRAAQQRAETEAKAAGMHLAAEREATKRAEKAAKR